MHRQMPTFLAILVVTFSILLRNCNGADCPPGTFINKSKCEPCPPGSFSDKQNATSCFLCSEGTFYPFHGGTTFSVCLLCRAGTYLPRRGARMESACTPCPTGTYSQAGAEQCVTCPPGSGLGPFTGTRCSLCDPGSYSDGTTKFCKRCPSGTQADVGFGATKCVPCAPGTFRDMTYITRIDQWKCDACPPNSFADKEGTKQCSLCPPGTIAEKGSTMCSPCPKNTFRATLRRPDCLPCSNGTVSEPGSAECKHKTRGCPFNTFEDRKRACRACAPGERYDRKKRDCVRCADDEASPGGAVTKCTKCTGNTAPAPDLNVFERSQCWCKLGYKRAADGSCEKCEAGTFGSLRPAGISWNNFFRYFRRREPECSACDIGSTSVEGATECTVCPPLTVSVSDSFAPKTCAVCPQGTRPDVVTEASLMGTAVQNYASECVTKRYSCRRGEVRDANGNCGASQGGCPWPQRRAFYGVCIACDQYLFWNAAKRNCDDCPIGTVNEASRPHTRTKCTLCQVGADFVKGKCECRDGLVKVGKRCRRCPDPLAYKDGKCVPCVMGASRSNGATTSCGTVCRGDSFLPNGATKCVPCPKGYQRMFDVVGNKVNRCAPVDVYAKVGVFTKY